MAHIHIPEGVPGIRGPMLLSPETTKPLRELVEILLRGPNSLAPAEREMIATYVSSENDCYYCQHSHGAAAAEHLGGNYELIDQIKRDYRSAPVSEKLKALLAIAGKVRQGGKQVTTADVERARAQGASDKEIHDTVLIAAAFCMFNRYVDGLATWQPQDPDMYREMGKRLAGSGYLVPGWERPVQKAQTK
ncbi:MAG: peroxidase-related enzyme [Candidatus Acidiferrales bacterium]